MKSSPNGAIRRVIAMRDTPSPLLRARPNLLDAALQLAASPQPECTSRSGRVLYSVAELAYPELTIQPRNSTAGVGVFVEKALLDAYRPSNAILSLALAGINAMSTEVFRTDKIEALVQYLEGEEDDQDKDKWEPWDWSLVALNTTMGFFRDTIGLTLLRVVEKVAKVRGTEMLQHCACPLCP